MSDRRLHLDLETRSTVDLLDANAYVYFDDPTTAIWLGAYAFSDDPEPKLWHPGEPCPPEIVDHIRSGGKVWGWNVVFERLAWRSILGPRHGWPIPDLRQFRCSMALSFAANMPGKLERAAPALGLDVLKDAQGARLMMKMARPRRPRKDEPDGLYWWDSEDEIRRLGEYCKQDVRAEMACHDRLVGLRPQEQEIWFLDQQINDFGIGVDVEFCRVADRLATEYVKELDRELAAVTDWAVTSVTSTNDLRAWLAAIGCPTASVAKDVLAELLARDDLPPKARRALEIRQEGSKASTAKLSAMLKRRQADGRMRGNLQYWGAGTGRWAGRGAQLQNLPRQPEGFNQDAAIDVLMRGSLRYAQMMHDEAPTELISLCLRGALRADPGNRLMAADFSMIEARVNPWLAGQEKTLAAFRAYDEGTGPDIYKVQAAGIYGVPVSQIGKDMRRQVGKVAVLALGFGGGPAAFIKMGKNYKLDVLTVEDVVWEAATPDLIERAEKGWESWGSGAGVDQRKWMIGELIKLAWRRDNDAIVRFWEDIENAAVEAAQEPGVVTSAGPIRYKKVGSHLFCQLPSGRALTYPYAGVAMRETPWEDADGNAVKKPTLVYKAMDVNNQWREHDFYGGLGCENVVQAVARDVMAEAMLRVHKAGYPVVLTVHDEVVCEVPNSHGGLAEFEALMVEIPGWARGLPVSAEAWEGARYRK